MREFNEIGDKVSVGTHSIIEHHVTVRDGVRIHSNVFVPEYTVLEEGVWIGPNAVLTNALYPNSRDAKKELMGAKVTSRCYCRSQWGRIPRPGPGVLEAPDNAG